jgi:hypothetical protein
MNTAERKKTIWLIAIFSMAGLNLLADEESCILKIIRVNSSTKHSIFYDRRM